jgi:hypothetical protein
VLLLWVYCTSAILFFGAEFTQVYADAEDCVIVPEVNALRRFTPNTTIITTSMASMTNMASSARNRGCRKYSTSQIPPSPTLPPHCPISTRVLRRIYCHAYRFLLLSLGNAALYLSACMLIGTGFLLEIRMDEENGAVRLFGMTPDDWGEIHLVIAIGFIVLTFLHLPLHLS